MEKNSIQDIFLNKAKNENIHLTIYLTNGFQFKGVVKAFDNFTLVLDTDGRQTLVYKHAISTIIPSKSLQFEEQDF